ncbi:MAG: YkgJ family cysteine cluster protein [Phaeospirillum sp.]|nr:YkgJ family cysteine cluster protein [Phaeospirillum sp.]
MISQFTPDSALNAIAAPRVGSPRTSPVRDAAFNAALAVVAAALPKGAQAAITAVGEVHTLADALWAEVRATPAFALGTGRAACGKGCGWCCHQRVGATAAEVLYVADELRKRPDAEALTARLDAWPTGRACAFLVEGACAIYEIRPLKCRGLYQMDARWCMTTYAKLDIPLFGPPPSHEYQIPPKDVFDGAVFGMALPFYRAGRDCPGVDFIPALKAVIHRPDAVQTWWRGEKVFPAETRLHDWFPPMNQPPQSTK